MGDIVFLLFLKPLIGIAQLATTILICFSCLSLLGICLLWKRCYRFAFSEKDPYAEDDLPHIWITLGLLVPIAVLLFRGDAYDLSEYNKMICESRFGLERIFVLAENSRTTIYFTGVLTGLVLTGICTVVFFMLALSWDETSSFLESKIRYNYKYLGIIIGSVFFSSPIFILLYDELVLLIV